MNRFRSPCHDRDLNADGRLMTAAYSNHGTTGTGTVALVSSARFFHDDRSISIGPAASIPVDLATSEVQMLVPA